MASAAAVGGEEDEKSLPYVLGLAVALPLPVAVSRMDAGVSRKARTLRPLPRASPAGWWAFRLPVPLPKEANSSSEEASPPRPTRLLSVCLGLGPTSQPDSDAAAAERPAKKARRCVQCGSTDTPQWRSGPMGRRTLCNACGVRLRAAGALREAAGQRPPPATPKKAAAPLPLPLESPASESSPDSPIYLVKKKKPSKKPWRQRNTGQQCLHCGATSTPQWREEVEWSYRIPKQIGVEWVEGSGVGGVKLVEWSDSFGSGVLPNRP